MKILMTQEQGRVPVTVIKPEGRINLGNAEELLQQARASYDQGVRDMLLDLGAIESVTSAGLRAILTIAKMLSGDRAGPSGEKEAASTVKTQHFKIANPQPMVKSVLDIAGFYTLIEIYEDLKEAIASF